MDGTFAITAPRGQGPFRVWAKAYRSGTGYSASANDQAEMRDDDCPVPGHLYDGAGSLTGGTGEINILLGYLYDGPGPFTWAEIGVFEVESPEEGLAALASELGVSVGDVSVSPGSAPGTYEVQVAGDPVISDMAWVIYSDGAPGEGGTHAGSGTMYAVDWVEG